MATAVGSLSRKPSMVKLHQPSRASGSAGMAVSKVSGSFFATRSSTLLYSSTATGLSPRALRQMMRLENASQSSLITMCRPVTLASPCTPAFLLSLRTNSPVTVTLMVLSIGGLPPFCMIKGAAGRKGRSLHTSPRRVAAAFRVSRCACSVRCCGPWPRQRRRCSRAQ